MLLVESRDRWVRFGSRYLAEYLGTVDVRVETRRDMPPASFEEERTSTEQRFERTGLDAWRAYAAILDEATPRSSNGP